MTIRTTFAPFVISAIFLAFFAGLTMAKGDDKKDRYDFYGIIQARPQNSLHGEWIIGNRSFTTGKGTEFDLADGPLTIGNCAKVHIRGGNIHEIDSEPLHDCQ